jgi:hypothetical protein
MPEGIRAVLRLPLIASAIGAAAFLAMGGDASAKITKIGCGGTSSASETKCVTAIPIPGTPLRSFDISWADAKTHTYFLGDRSNAGIDVIDGKKLKFITTIKGFVGVVLNSTGTAVNNAKSGPDGVTQFGRWLYGGDGNSTLKVIDLKAHGGPAITQSISTGGLFRVDEMALTSDGKQMLAANNADDPTFATLFNANGNNKTSNVTIVRKYTVSPTVLPVGFGLSLEQPAWEPVTKRFYTSVPVIANNPPGCDFGQGGGGPPCQGGILVTDPTSTNTVAGVYSPATRTGVFALTGCAPNGSAVGPDSNILFGCTPGNNPNDSTTWVVNVLDPTLFKIAAILHITGSDEDWYDSGNHRYYAGASKAIGGAVLGVIDADTNLLVETIKQSANSHSVAADNKLNRIFVPQVAPVSVVGSGGDTTTVGQALCGGTNGCVVVYESTVHHSEE